MSHDPLDGGPTIHCDQLSGREVFIAPRRAGRPNDLAAGSAERCPFCAGNEACTAPELLRWPAPAAGRWKARIVPNRYPVVEPFSSAAPAPDRRPASVGPSTTAAHGRHEVVIESPTHVGSVLEVPAADWRQVWELCRQRLGELAAAGDSCWATVFKNGGLAAGASLEHVHSQLIAIDRVPPVIAEKCRRLSLGKTRFADLLDAADAEDRTVCRRGGLAALVPPATRQPFEVWLVPETVEPFFHRAGPEQIEAVAELTRRFVAALDRLVPGGSYNWWLHQFPTAGAAEIEPLASHWHWHLEMLPRLAPLAGFELGTGCHIATVLPTTAARLLRATGCW